MVSSEVGLLTGLEPGVDKGPQHLAKQSPYRMHLFSPWAEGESARLTIRQSDPNALNTAEAVLQQFRGERVLQLASQHPAQRAGAVLRGERAAREPDRRARERADNETANTLLAAR